jgi:hypothetical protein
MLYELEMVLREEGYSDFIYDEEKDLFRFKDGRFAFSRTQADVKLLGEQGYKAQGHGQLGTLLPVGELLNREESARRNELANLYARGVHEGYDGELFGSQAEDVQDIPDVFGEDGLRAYLMGVIEGEEDAREDEEETLAKLESDDEEEEGDPLDDEDFGQEPNPQLNGCWEKGWGGTLPRIPPAQETSPSQASELLQKRVVLPSRLLAFQPLHVSLNPEVMAFRFTLSGQTHLPVSRPLITVGALRQFHELTTSIGVGGGLHCGFEGLACLLDEGLCLAHKDFLYHL